MSLPQVRSWVKQMEKLYQADIPYKEIGGVDYTPRMILNEAENNSQVWQYLRELL